MEQKITDCAIIISSCDGYSDAWEPFFTLFFRYWPDCPYKTLLISNTKEYKDLRVETIFANPDLGWSGNLKSTLKKIKEKYIIYLQEDYFLKEKVSTQKIISALELADKNNAAYVRLFPCPGPNLPFSNNQKIGLISKDAHYRNSTQAAIWNKEILVNLLNDKESGWDFETKGGLERSRDINKIFLAYKEPVINYFCTAIVKGVYLYDAVKFVKKEGLKLNRQARKFENFFHYIFRVSGLKGWLKRNFYNIYAKYFKK